MTGILEGIKIVDWTVFQVGPFATAMLADMGADVIHVEDKERGDHLRWNRFSKGLNLYREGRPVHFEEHNRNKRGIAVDLRKQEGREIIYQLVKGADVFATNLRQKAIDSLGMDYETLKRHNPKLIYAHATGYGRNGPDSDLPSVDNSGMARSGLMMASGYEGDPPTPLSVGTSDRTTSFMLAHGILGALLARERFGIGQYVHTSMLGANLVLHGWTVLAPLLMGAPYPRANRYSPGGAGYSAYRCQDDRWVVLGALNDRHWEQVVRVLDDPRLLEDPRFATAESRKEYTVDLVHVMEEALMKKTAQEWQDTVREKGSDLIFAICNTTTDLPNDPQVTLNNYIMDWNHPAWGPVKWVGFPIDWSETPATLRRAAPTFGEHTEEVLLEMGYTWKDISRLQDVGAI